MEEEWEWEAPGCTTLSDEVKVKRETKTTTTVEETETTRVSGATKRLPVQTRVKECVGTRKPPRMLTLKAAQVCSGTGMQAVREAMRVERANEQAEMVVSDSQQAGRRRRANHQRHTHRSRRKYD